MSDTNVNGKHRTPRLHNHTDLHWRAVLVGDKQRAPTIADVQSYLLQVCDGNTTATGLITGNKAHVDHKLHGLHDQLTAVGFYILTNDVVFRNAIIGKNNDSFSMYLQPTTKYVDDVTFNSALKDAVDRYNQQRDSAPSTAPETNAGSTGAQATPATRYALRSGTQSDSPQRGEGKSDSAADGGANMDVDNDTGALDSAPSATATLPLDPYGNLSVVTTSDVGLHSYHKEYMYSEDLRKANAAIHSHNERVYRAVTSIGADIYRALFSINKTYPGLLPLIDVRNDGTDIRTGFAVWEKARDSIGLNRKDDPSIHTSRTKWENANRHIEEGPDGLGKYEVRMAGMVAEHNDKARGAAQNQY